MSRADPLLISYPGLKARACSGLTLSGAPLPRPSKARLGAAEWVNEKPKHVRL